MKTPIVTLNLDRYNELLKAEKDYKDGFKTFAIKKYNIYCFGWSNETSVYLETNSDGIKKLGEEFETILLDIEMYNKKSIWYRIFHKV